MNFNEWAVQNCKKRSDGLIYPQQAKDAWIACKIEILNLIESFHGPINSGNYHLETARIEKLKEKIKEL